MIDKIKTGSDVADIEWFRFKDLIYTDLLCIIYLLFVEDFFLLFVPFVAALLPSAMSNLTPTD